MKLNSPNKRVSRSADGDAPPQIALHNPAPPAFNCVVPGIISESFVVEHKPGSRRLQGVFHANSFAYRSINAQTNPRESQDLSLIHISEPTRLGMISYAVFCLKK